MYTQLRRNAVLAAGAMALILLMAIGCGEESPQQYESTGSSDTEKLSVTRPAYPTRLARAKTCSMPTAHFVTGSMLLGPIKGHP